MLTTLIVACAMASDPIALHPRNPHYFLFRGKPTILITSGEHYGAVLNLDFDFVPYLDTLAHHGFNQTRTFSGTYREVPGAFRIENNTLAPKPNRYLAPWKRTDEANGNTPERFDLDSFDPAYFERLRRFVEEAGKRGIVVEYVLFCPLYEQNLWDVNPMNARNNINAVGECPREEVYTLKHPKLLERQLAFVRKVVGELRQYDNLYYEICNEPYFGGVTLEWQERVADAVSGAEEEFAHEHMIAQNIANEKSKVERPVHPAVSVLNFHYAEPEAALENQSLALAVGDDETGFDGIADRPYRTEAWLFLLSGGSLFSHLDYSFTPDHEDGTAKIKEPTPGGGGAALRDQLAILKRFLEDFNFLEMTTAQMTPGGENKSGVRMAVLAEPGAQYAVYLDRSAGRGIVKFDMPPGTYKGEWLDPRTGRVLRAVVIDHPGGAAAFVAPEYKEDIALRLKAAAKP
jgi:hypothetical protein